MEKIPKTAREKNQFEIDNLNLQIKEMRNKLDVNNAEWIERCKRFRKQDADIADAKYDALLSDVQALVDEWEREADFLITNSVGSDISVGNTYKECANKLKAIAAVEARINK